VVDGGENLENDVLLYFDIVRFLLNQAVRMFLLWGK